MCRVSQNVHGILIILAKILSKRKNLVHVCVLSDFITEWNSDYSCLQFQQTHIFCSFIAFAASCSLPHDTTSISQQTFLLTSTQYRLQLNARPYNVRASWVSFQKTHIYIEDMWCGWSVQEDPYFGFILTANLGYTARSSACLVTSYRQGHQDKRRFK
jgi:hypothetical protein